MSPSLLNFLAIVADLYNPLLLLMCLAACVYEWRKGFRWYGVRLFAIAIASYAAMFLDQGLSLWSCVGLDFSTHTATALGMVLFLAALTAKPLAYTLLGSLVVYCWVMFVEGYHSWADMASTGLVMSAVFYSIFILTQKLVHKSAI